jgi:hypothetical protein
VLAFLGVAARLGWASRGWPLVHDAPIMHYIAWRIGEGAMPYRDVFDMNFPGVYLVHLGVLRTLGPGDGAWRIFDLAWLAGGALAIAAFARRWGPVAAAGGAAVFVVYHLAAGPWQTGQRDFLLCPLLVLGALAVARWLEGRATPAGLAAGGLALGAAITIKPHVVVLFVALGCLVASRGLRGARTASARALLGYVAGAAAPVVGVVVWLGIGGALGAWREIVLGYLLPLYSRLGESARWGFHRWTLWIPLAAAVVVSVARAALSGASTPRRLVALTGLGYGVLHYVGQGKGWEYHTYPAAAFAAVLAFSGFDPALASARGASWPRVLTGLALVAALAVALGMLSVKGVEASHAEWVDFKVQRARAVARTLAPRLRPDDLVQILDTTEGGADVLLRLHAREPTRFIYDFHFYHDVQAPMIQRLRAELVRDLDARPPRFILLYERGWPGGGYDRVATFPALAERLERRYRVERTADGVRIYAQRDRP